MNELKSLIEKAKKYLESAKMLLEGGDFDSSVSRTYYAMFYTAQAALLTKDLSFSSHGGTIAAFGEHFIKTKLFPKKMGRELNRAFEKRQLGDYAAKSTISEEEAKKLLEQGQKFVDRIVEYLRKQRLL